MAGLAGHRADFGRLIAGGGDFAVKYFGPDDAAIASSPQTDQFDIGWLAAVDKIESAGRRFVGGKRLALVPKWRNDPGVSPTAPGSTTGFQLDPPSVVKNG